MPGSPALRSCWSLRKFSVPNDYKAQFWIKRTATTQEVQCPCDFRPTYHSCRRTTINAVPLFNTSCTKLHQVTTIKCRSYTNLQNTFADLTLDLTSRQPASPSLISLNPLYMKMTLTRIAIPLNPCLQCILLFAFQISINNLDLYKDDLWMIDTGANHCHK